VAADNGEFTLGVEEEYQIVNPVSRELRPRAGRILPAAQAAVGDEATTELYQSQIEIGTPVCRTLGEARAELIRLRRALAEAAGREGCRIAAAGTHPFSCWQDQPLTPRERYRGIADDYQQVAREQVVFGCHVHVGFADREEAIQVMNRARPWLPPLIALAANSPFWQGADTGYASYRTELFQRFPMTGTPHPFASRAEYDDLVAGLVGVGMIEDASKLYWDVRPSSHFETLEFRVADVCMAVDEAMMVAGLCRALARACRDAHRGGEPAAPARPELLRAAKWYASRYGLDGDLIDVPARRAAPAAEVVEGLLAFLRPALEGQGDWDEVSALVRQTVRRGNGARRQREAFARAGRLEDVVDLLVAETAQGL
jgi:carboxylate-amine ligase